MQENRQPGADRAAPPGSVSLLPRPACLGLFPGAFRESLRVQPSSVADLMFNLLIVLAAGLVAGVAAKRLGISMLVGYLVVGTLLGAVGFGPMTEGQPGLG